MGDKNGGGGRSHGFAHAAGALPSGSAVPGGIEAPAPPRSTGRRRAVAEARPPAQAARAAVCRRWQLASWQRVLAGQERVQSLEVTLHRCRFCGWELRPNHRARQRSVSESAWGEPVCGCTLGPMPA